MYALPLTNLGDASVVIVQDGQRLARTVDVRGRQITLLIHLCLMVVNGTCYSVFIALWRRTKVLSTRDHPRRFRWDVQSYSVSHVR